LERLRKERIETLEKAFQRLRKQLDVGTVALSDVIDIQREILEAQLEATDKLEERIGFLKAQLVSAQDLFDFIQKHVAAGFKYTETDLYRAKANCLKVEIELAKEEAKLEDSK
jgi:outer membrane protein TolC